MGRKNPQRAAQKTTQTTQKIVKIGATAKRFGCNKRNEK